MSADVIHDPNYPHGTPAGYTNGCRGSHCPNRITCRAVHMRYVGDFTFRNQFEAGLSAAEIVKREQEALQRALDERKAQKRVVLPPKKNRPANRPLVSSTGRHHEPTVRQLHKHGWDDADIAQHIGITRRSVCGIRHRIGLPSIRGINKTTVRQLHTRGYTDTQIADHINKNRHSKVNRRSVSATRLRLGLPPNPPQDET